MQLSNRQAAELLGILRLSMSCGILSNPTNSPMEIATILALDMAIGALVEKQQADIVKRTSTASPKQ